jgi:hypothetical protein
MELYRASMPSVVDGPRIVVDGGRLELVLLNRNRSL